MVLPLTTALSHAEPHLPPGRQPSFAGHVCTRVPSPSMTEWRSLEHVVHDPTEPPSSFGGFLGPRASIEPAASWTAPAPLEIPDVAGPPPQATSDKLEPNATTETRPVRMATTSRYAGN